ncbi:hypothetical protein RFI_20550 [Reticulomyxa filosa]|uniref:Uncharacterized protein n=1 Tax=Reticulomyxa filosa TaxID=46433 RepID=X6MSG4_RETFI|nr:hypothetical protein RFI_20550 [Reticulomyxa filosa]|eukprot:ETO16789.1 hypothetical protein RFI_20550 [Reticulomyxa filosa]
MSVSNEFREDIDVGDRLELGEAVSHLKLLEEELQSKENQLNALMESGLEVMEENNQYKMEIEQYKAQLAESRICLETCKLQEAHYREEMKSLKATNAQLVSELTMMEEKLALATDRIISMDKEKEKEKEKESKNEKDKNGTNLPTNQSHEAKEKDNGNDTFILSNYYEALTSMQNDMKKYEQEMDELKEKEKNLSEYVQCLIVEKLALEKQVLHLTQVAQHTPHLTQVAQHTPHLFPPSITPFCHGQATPNLAFNYQMELSRVGHEYTLASMHSNPNDHDHDHDHDHYHDHDHRDYNDNTNHNVNEDEQNLLEELKQLPKLPLMDKEEEEEEEEEEDTSDRSSQMSENDNNLTINVDICQQHDHHYHHNQPALEQEEEEEEEVEKLNVTDIAKTSSLVQQNGSSKELKSNDAYEEYLHLTCAALKIQHPNVDVSSEALLQMVRVKKLPFWRVYDYLSRYLLERMQWEEHEQPKLEAADAKLDYTASQKLTQPAFKQSTASRFLHYIWGNHKNSSRSLDANSVPPVDATIQQGSLSWFLLFIFKTPLKKPVIFEFCIHNFAPLFKIHKLLPLAIFNATCFPKIKNLNFADGGHPILNQKRFIVEPLSIHF